MRTADPNAPTKESLMKAASDLFVVQGFTATSVDEICARAGATKGSFFHFFKSKDELGKAVMRRFVEQQIERGRTADFRRRTDPAERVLGWVDMVIASFADASKPKSCLVGTLTQELAPTRPGFRAVSAECFERWTAVFIEDLAAAEKARPLALGASPRRLADMFTALIQGSLILIKASGDQRVGVENMRQFRAYLEAALGVRERAPEKRSE